MLLVRNANNVLPQLDSSIAIEAFPDPPASYLLIFIFNPLKTP